VNKLLITFLLFVGMSYGAPGFWARQVGTLANIPATCATGDLYFRTDTTPGTNLYECNANTWTQSSGGGGGSGTVSSATIGQVAVYTGATTVGGNADFTFDSTGKKLNIGAALDPSSFAFGNRLNVIGYTTDTSFINSVQATVYTPIALVSGPTANYFYTELNGTFGYSNNPVALSSSLDYNSTGASTFSSQAPSMAIFGTANLNGAASITGSLVGVEGSAQVQVGSLTNAVGVWGWVGNYGTAISSKTAAFYAQATTTGGTWGASAFNVAYFNENQTGIAGVGKDFAWYSEGGTNHLETGSDATVGAEIEQHSATQSADLLRVLASDGTTVLSAPADSTGAGRDLSVAFSSLGTPANATRKYCSDCKVTSGVDDTCTNTGSGAMALRINGAWKCVQ
jgi:hypothetical protein